MRCIYVIGSYRGADRLRRLVRRLNTSSPGARVVVLRDRKADPVHPEDLGNCEVRVTAHPITWGDSSHLLAVLDLLGRLDAAPHDWITLLSDESYPVRPLNEFEQHLRNVPEDSLLTCFDIPEGDPYGISSRYRSLSVRLPLGHRSWVRRVALAVDRRTFVRFQTGRPGTPIRVDVPRRRPHHLEGTTIHAGNDWYVLRGTAVAALLELRHQPLLRYLTRTFSPSEAYVHTVVMNHPAIRNRAETSHYTLWRGRAHPEVLSEEHLPEVLASGAWFARKFADGRVLDELDAHLGG